MERLKNNRWRKVLLGSGILLLTLGVGFCAFGSPLIDSMLNQKAKVALPEVTPEAQALHEQLFIADMHADTLMWQRDLLQSSSRGHVDLPRLQAGNVGLQIFSSVSKTPVGQNYDSNSAAGDTLTLLVLGQLQPLRTWNSLLERSLYHAEKLHTAAEKSNGNLRMITTRSELQQLIEDRAAGRKVTGALFSLEGLQNLEGDFNNLQKLYDAGARMAGFTHFFDTEVSGSMHGEEKGGLTELGRQVFQEMERLGMVIDIAHASHTAMAEMLALATKPVVASHGGVQATCAVNRNLTDEEIRGIAATGGVVGIGYWDAAVCELSVTAVVDAIEHVIEVGGIETAALGSDFDGGVTVPWDPSQLAVITQELLNRGYSEQDIAAILGGNTRRVLLEVLP